VSDILQFDHDDDNVTDDFRWTSPSSTMPDALRQCIQATFEADYEVVSLSHLTIAGRTYSTPTQHMGNSQILLKSGIPGQMIPARIDYITQITISADKEDLVIPYVAARKYQPLDFANTSDPFRAYPCLQAGLWSEDLGDLGLYPLEAIETHFASLPISWEGQHMMVVISLSRVSSLKV
jgi:hypothetical protein